MYREYARLDLPGVDKEILAKWQEEGVYEKIKKGFTIADSADQKRGEFVFFEGPPSANGQPGIHHVLARTIKDIFCRYKSMCGYVVHRKAGWDTHGLPVELGVEKMLNITKEDIGSKISITDYNDACRKAVMKYTKEWTELTKMMGYWIDLDNPYITYDNKYIESVWYLLKELYKKGYLYKGYTIQPYSPVAGTGLSSHELNLPGCYKDVKDTTCTAQFKINGHAFIKSLSQNFVSDIPIYALAWTTTPWTLPSNTALCVGKNIDYVLVRGYNPYTKEEAYFLLAEARLGAYSKELLASEIPADEKIVWRGKGEQLVGISYEQLIPWWHLDIHQKAFCIIAGDYVTTEEGTGIVHIAPTFGADDAFVAKKYDIAGVLFLTNKGEWKPMVDSTGKFFLLRDLDANFVNQHLDIDAYKKWEGRYVKNAYDASLSDEDETLDISLCIDLKKTGRAFRVEKHVHNYPHCWRTDKPILYYPMDSWFIRVTKVKEDMVKLNNTIHWQPSSTGTGRFGKWLENANDWNLSRSRFWGIPLPIWRTEDGKEEKCIGSIEELFQEIELSIQKGLMQSNPWKNFVVGDYSVANYDSSVIDLHRPFVDNIILASSEGKPMYREADLIDVWFDSGSMPYAQNHYPFENIDAPRTADFISEGVDQTRGWFYTLHAIHTMIENKVAFHNVISNGLVLDKEGNKMSKRLGNAIEPFEIIRKYGADAVRWYMITNSNPWDNIKFDIEGVEEVQRKFFGTLFNTYAFYALYANVDKVNSSILTQVKEEDFTQLDKWILARLQTLIKNLTASYENYDPTSGNRLISTFVQDDLSNWYVRLNRKRFWGGTMNGNKIAAYYTLDMCLRHIALLVAPIAPFYSDMLYRDLTGMSVHERQWPKIESRWCNEELEQSMELAQQITGMILSLRKKAQINVRQPLQKVVLPILEEKTRTALSNCIDIVKNEVNVKEIEIVHSDNANVHLIKKIKPRFQILGKKAGGDMKEVASQINTFSENQVLSIEKGGEEMITLMSGKRYTITKEDVEIITEDMPGWLVTNLGTLTVALDITITQSLKEEGIARELINRIQNLRKTKNYEITDRIAIILQQHPQIVSSVDHFKDYIAGQVLANSIEWGEADFENFIDIENIQIGITLNK